MPFFYKLTIAFWKNAWYNGDMNKNSTPKETKYFPYQFTKTMLVLAIAVIALCIAGIGVSVYRIVRFGIRDFTDALQSPLLIVICVFCIAVVVCMLIKSQYIVDDTYYTTQFGFIKSKFLIKDVTRLELDTDTKKLTVFVGEEFSVLSLSEKWQDEFISAIRAVKPEIDFTFTLAENKEQK